MYRILSNALLALSLVLTAGLAHAASSPDPAHSSRNALDWAGTYEGTLPCAGCPGVRTRLTLRRDETFELSSKAVGRDPQPRVVQGRFAWQPGGNALTLDTPPGRGLQVLVGEGRVAVFDAGATPNWAKAQHRSLQRVAALSAGDVQRTLSAHAWTLTGATDARGQELAALRPNAKRPVVLGFADDRISMDGGCNRSFGGYRIDADGRLVAARMASTLMACDGDLMKVDAALADLFAGPMTIDLSSGATPTLRLVAASGATLAFSGRMTPEARYGAPSRVFLEVAAQTVACPNPPPGATRCLQVRELQFDNQGLRVGTPGPWQALAEAIEGYAHTAGVRNVLRVKRFDRGAASGSLYVLDLVVESEVVQR